jgi:hypothetical protein
MRKKERTAVAAPDLEKAWSAFFESASVEDPAELKKQGWKTNAEIAALAKSENDGGRQLADSYVRQGILEKKSAKIMVGGKRRILNFYRPKGQ